MEQCVTCPAFTGLEAIDDAQLVHCAPELGLRTYPGDRLASLGPLTVL